MQKLSLKFSAGVVVLAFLVHGTAHAQSSTPIYLDPQQPVERRVDDLMSRMTLKEKVGQLNLPCVYVDQLGTSLPQKMAAAKRFAAGTYTDEIGPGAGFFTLADLRQLFRDLIALALKLSRNRLGFPVQRLTLQCDSGIPNLPP